MRTGFYAKCMIHTLMTSIGMPCITEDGKFVHYSNPCGERVAYLLSRTRQVGNYICILFLNT